MQIFPITDSHIEQRVVKGLQREQELCAKELCVFCADGVVNLKGSVGSYRSKMIAESLALRTEGVLSVVNEIVIRSARGRVKIKRPRPNLISLPVAASSLQQLHR